METKYFYNVKGQVFGPVSGEDVRRLATEGTLQPTDLIQKEGMTKWIRAGDVSGLVFPASMPPPLPPKQQAVPRASLTLTPCAVQVTACLTLLTVLTAAILAYDFGFHAGMRSVAPQQSLASTPADKTRNDKPTGDKTTPIFTPAVAVADTKPAHTMMRADFRDKITHMTTTGPNMAEAFGEPDLHNVQTLMQGGSREKYERLHWLCKDGGIEVVIYSNEDECNKPLVDHWAQSNLIVEAVNDENATYPAIPPPKRTERHTVAQIKAAEDYSLTLPTGLVVDLKTEYSVDEMHKAFSESHNVETLEGIATEWVSQIEVDSLRPVVKCTYFNKHVVEIRFHYERTIPDPKDMFDKLRRQFGEPDSTLSSANMWKFPSISREVTYGWAEGLAGTSTENQSFMEIAVSKSGWVKEALIAKDKKKS